jgi:hypothetical protein
MPQKKWLVLGAIFALIVLSMRAELHVPNMIPIGALALWAGAYLGKRCAVLLIYGLMLIGDAGNLIHGRYPWWLAATVYTAMLVYVVFGAALARHIPNGWRKMGGSLIAACAGSLVYFIVTNGAVWAFSTLVSEGWYPKSTAGFITCLTAGIPFWRNDLLVNAGGAVIFFGVSALITATSRARTSAVVWQAASGSQQ